MAYRKRNASETEVANGALPAGMYVVGKITNRTRRYITTSSNPNTEIVTYTIIDDHERRYFIDDFAPLSYYEVSSPVTLSVYVKPFVKRNGDASYTLCIQKNYHPITKGEAF